MAPTLTPPLRLANGKPKDSEITCSITAGTGTAGIGDFEEMRAMRSRHDDDDDVVQDGESIRVPVYLMDATQRAVATEGLRLHDGLGNPAGHKRGYVFGGN